MLAARHKPKGKRGRGEEGKTGDERKRGREEEGEREQEQGGSVVRCEQERAVACAMLVLG